MSQKMYTYVRNWRLFNNQSTVEARHSYNIKRWFLFSKLYLAVDNINQWMLSPYLLLKSWLLKSVNLLKIDKTNEKTVCVEIFIENKFGLRPYSHETFWHTIFR